LIRDPLYLPAAVTVPGLLQLRDRLLELVWIGTPSGMAETGRRFCREDHRVMEEVTPTAKLHGLALPPVLLEAHHTGEEIKRLLGLGRQELDMPELGGQSVFICLSSSNGAS
jgi:hypothetical protein